MATIDERGLTIDKLPDVLAKLRVGLNGQFASILPVGQELDYDASSVLSRLISPIVEAITLQEEALQNMYSSLDITTATGAKLDDLCMLGGVIRNEAQPADAMLMLYGVSGLTIPADSYASSKITGDTFKTLTDVLLNNSSCNGVDLQLTQVGTNHTCTLTWLSDSNQNTNVPIVVSILSTDSVTQAITKIKDAITSTTDKLTSTIVGDYLQVSFTDKNETGSFTLTNSNPINYFKPVDSICIVSGANPQDRNTITTIQTSILGWLGVNNPFDATEGTDKETDEQLRKRYFIRRLSDGSSQKEHMYSAISAISGVRYVDVTDNKLSSTVGGIPANSFAVTVLGGDPDAIAAAIADNMPLGIGMVGDVTVETQDFNDNTVEVKFSRPSLVPIQISMTLSVDNTFPDNGVALIRQAIIDHISEFDVGDDVLYSRLFTPINTINGHSILNLQVARVGGVLGNSNITLAYNELATISYSDISFGG